VPGLDRISTKIDQSPMNPWKPCVRDSATTQANLTPCEAGGGREKASHHVGQARGASEKPLIIGRACKKEAAATHLLHQPSPLEGGKNEFPVPPQSCRIKPQLISCIVDVSYAAPQAHGIVNVALHREYSLGIVFIFFPREEGSLSCLRLTLGVIPMSTTMLYRGYVN
jgi:hypothetical protein